MVRETVTPNHYATLGLSPASEDVVIRAAYLALMRRYHPDRNPSAEAAARAREVAAAYAVLGDPGRRAEYDEMWVLGAGPMEPPPAPGSPMIPGGAFTAASLSLALAVVFLVAWSPIALPEPQNAGIGAEAHAGPRAEATEPVALAARDEAVAAARPTAPGPERTQPRLRPDRPEPAPPVRLAQASPPRVAEAPAAAIAKPRPAALAAATRPSAPKPAAARSSPPAATPSFSCQFAKTRGEIAVCRNVQLANLDRQQALLYSQSWGRADAARRALLLRSRERFVAQRDKCRSDACTTSAYLARMREVSEIMTGDAKTTP